ncbi:hypothetical protein DESA109040_02455 [Deinococcus saxicola]|uniref:hypothetical protein n=1 Tax=Deinococcus saxicola TaxID=249406 RepID=UPI0039F00E8E
MTRTPHPDLPLTPEAVTTAWRLAGWPVGNLDLAQILALPVITAAAIEALGRPSSATGGDMAPTVTADGLIVDRDGLAAWTILPTGTLRLSVSRPWDAVRDATQIRSIQGHLDAETRDQLLAAGSVVLTLEADPDGTIIAGWWTQDQTTDLRLSHLETAQDLVMAAQGKRSDLPSHTLAFRTAFAQVITWVAEAEAADAQMLNVPDRPPSEHVARTPPSEHVARTVRQHRRLRPA